MFGRESCLDIWQTSTPIRSIRSSFSRYAVSFTELRHLLH